MATKTVSFTLNRTTAHLQEANVAPGPVVMMSSAAAQDGKIVIWINVDAEDQAPEDWKLRTFMLLGDYGPTPNGYIHQGSMLHPSFGALHLYEYVEAAATPEVNTTFRELEPILAFRLIVQGKLCGVGEVDRDGAMDLLRCYVDLGHFSAENFINHALEHRTATMKIEGQNDKEHYLAFTRL